MKIQAQRPTSIGPPTTGTPTKMAGMKIKTWEPTTGPPTTTAGINATTKTWRPRTGPAATTSGETTWEQTTGPYTITAETETTWRLTTEPAGTTPGKTTWQPTNRPSTTTAGITRITWWPSSIVPSVNNISIIEINMNYNKSDNNSLLINALKI